MFVALRASLMTSTRTCGTTCARNCATHSALPCRAATSSALATADVARLWSRSRRVDQSQPLHAVDRAAPRRATHSAEADDGDVATGEALLTVHTEKGHVPRELLVQNLGLLARVAVGCGESDGIAPRGRVVIFRFDKGQARGQGTRRQRGAGRRVIIVMVKPLARPRPTAIGNGDGCRNSDACNACGDGPGTNVPTTHCTAIPARAR